jgi:HPt (histidine-containing phosphotransfer) domain-containing protein
MSTPKPPFHTVTDELLYGIYLKFNTAMNALKREDIDTLSKLNAILTDAQLVKSEELTTVVSSLKGNVPASADTLEKIYNLVQGLNFLSAQDIDTLAELNAVLADADIVKTEDVVNAISALRGNVPANADTLEKIYNLLQSLHFLTAQDIDTLAELNAILSDADVIKSTDLTQAIHTLKGNAPVNADTLEKLFNLIQGLTNLTRQDIDTLAELNAILTDADLVKSTDLLGLYSDRGNYNASVNAFPSTGGSGSGGAILKGNVWTISQPGIMGGQTVVPNQTVRALIDAPGQNAANWFISLYFSTDGNLTLGTGLAGTQRSINAAGTQPNIDLKLNTKNNGNIILNSLGTIYANTDILIQRSTAIPKLVLTRSQVVSDNAVIASIQLEGVSATGQNRVYGRIDALVEDDTNTSEDGKLDIKVSSAGIEVSVLKFSGSKNLQAEFCGPVKLKSYQKANVPPASDHVGGIVLVPDESGGATLAFSDGANWRRVQDRGVIS